MWICANCGTENEENFKFCWGCGQSRAKVEIFPEPPQADEPVEKIPDAPRQTISETNISEPPQKIEEIPAAAEPEPLAAKESAEQLPPPPEIAVSRPKPAARRIETDDEEVMPMLARVAGGAKGAATADADTSLERKVFTIAVRLVGLFFLYQVLVALPDLVLLINSAVKNTTELSDALTSALIIPVATVLFYLVVGIYLIASGRLLIGLLPDR